MQWKSDVRIWNSFVRFQRLEKSIRLFAFAMATLIVFRRACGMRNVRKSHCMGIVICALDGDVVEEVGHDCDSKDKSQILGM